MLLQRGISNVGGNLTIANYDEEAAGDYHCTRTYNIGTIAGPVVKLRVPGLIFAVNHHFNDIAN